MEQICRQCGKPLRPDANFCGKCGARVIRQPSPAPRPSPTPNPAPKPSPVSKPASNWKPAVLFAVAALVLVTGICFAVHLSGEHRADKLGNKNSQPYMAAQPRTPTGESDEQSKEEPWETPDSPQTAVLSVDANALSWTGVRAGSELYFEVPEGFEEQPQPAEPGMTYGYYSDTLDMLLRVWDNTVSYVETDYLHGEYLYPYHGTVNERSLQTWENGRTYSCSGSQGRLAYVYETWGSQYAYYFMYEYPPCSSEADSAYYAIFLAFLNRLSCDTEFVDEDPDYILPQSAQRRLTEDDLSGLTHEELCLARNEIYARHGRRFKNQNIASYFESKDWYVGSIDPETFDANQSSYFSQDELYNATFLLNYEKQKFGKSFY